ncbi:MAG: hypothetical protein GY756_05375 [bacterium]|nr:hypothetical protein [bacterium]
MEISVKKMVPVPEMIELIFQEDIITIMKKVCAELDNEGYKTSFKYTGNASDALSSALNPEASSMVPEIFVFLPNAQLVPPDPNTSLKINLEIDKEAVGMLNDVIISYSNGVLEENANYISEKIRDYIMQH